jgi:hypothetical protein
MKLVAGFGGLTLMLRKTSVTLTPLQWRRFSKASCPTLGGGCHWFTRFGPIEIVSPNSPQKVSTIVDSLKSLK